MSAHGSPVREARRAAGLCLYCGVVPEAGFVACSACRAANRVAVANRPERKARGETVRRATESNVWGCGRCGARLSALVEHRCPLFVPESVGSAVDYMRSGQSAGGDR